jgi:hypothetical protein
MHPVDDLDRVVAALLTARTVSYFDLQQNWAQIPSTLGVYAIYLTKDVCPSKGLIVGRCLHAGASGIPRGNRPAGPNGLRGRLRDNHLNGGGQGAEGDLVEKVQRRGFATNRADAQMWISNNCGARWLSGSYDDAFIRWAEHRLLSQVQPLWGS